MKKKINFSKKSLKKIRKFCKSLKNIFPTFTEKERQNIQEMLRKMPNDFNIEFFPSKKDNYGLGPVFCRDFSVIEKRK